MKDLRESDLGKSAAGDSEKPVKKPPQILRVPKYYNLFTAEFYKSECTCLSNHIHGCNMYACAA